MQARDTLFELGKVIRAKGVKGEIEVFLDSDNPGYYKNMESLLLEINQQLVPFFIETIRITGRFAIIKFDGISTLEDALMLVDAKAFLPLEKLPPLEEKRFYFHELTGCRVVDKNHGYIGEISNIYDQPEQPIAELKRNGKELLFPLIKIFIEKFDRENNTLYVNLPDGLLEIYM